jgi:chromosome segregation ATPase
MSSSPSTSIEGSSNANISPTLKEKRTSSPQRKTPKSKQQYEEHNQLLQSKLQYQLAEIHELYDKVQELQREKLIIQQSSQRIETEKEEPRSLSPNIQEKGILEQFTSKNEEYEGILKEKESTIEGLKQKIQSLENENKELRRNYESVCSLLKGGKTQSKEANGDRFTTENIINEYIEIMKDIDTLEFTCNSQTAELYSEIQQLTNALHGTKQKNGNLSQELNSFLSEEQELALLVDSLSNELRDARESNKELELKYEKEIKLLNKKLEIANKELELQNIIMKQKEKDLNEICDSLRKDKRNLQEQIKKLETLKQEGLYNEKEQEESNRRIEKLEKELEKKGLLIARYEEKITSLKIKIKMLTVKIRETEAKNASILAEQRKLQQNVEEQVSQIEKNIAEQENRSREMIRHIQEKNKALEEEIALLQNYIRSLEIHTQKLEQHNLDLQSEIRSDKKKISLLKKPSILE